MFNEAAISSFHSLVRSNNATNALETIIIDYARRLMARRVCRKHLQDDGAIRHSQLDNESVLRRISCVCVEMELRVRRLGWWQTVAKNQRDHVALLACLFGDFCFDGYHCNSLLAPMFNNANPWTKHLRHDLRVLSVMHDCIAQVSSFELERIFAETGTQEELCFIDVAALRAGFLAVQFGADNWNQTESPNETQSAIYLDASPVECPTEGCGEAVFNLHASTSDMFRSSTIGHGIETPSFKYCPCSHCLCCLSYFSTRQTRLGHLFRPSVTRICNHQRSPTITLRMQTATLKCPDEHSSHF